MVGVELGSFRTVGRVELGTGDLMTISRQHMEFAVDEKTGVCTVRALHQNPIRLFRAGEPQGVLLSKFMRKQSARMRAGDIIECGDVRGLMKDGKVFSFRLHEGSWTPQDEDQTRSHPTSRSSVSPEVIEHADSRTIVEEPVPVDHKPLPDVSTVAESEEMPTTGKTVHTPVTANQAATRINGQPTRTADEVASATRRAAVFAQELHGASDEERRADRRSAAEAGCETTMPNHTPRDEQEKNNDSQFGFRKRSADEVRSFSIACRKMPRLLIGYQGSFE